MSVLRAVKRTTIGTLVVTSPAWVLGIVGYAVGVAFSVWALYQVSLILLAVSVFIFGAFGLGQEIQAEKALNR